MLLSTMLFILICTQYSVLYSVTTIEQLYGNHFYRQADCTKAPTQTHAYGDRNLSSR